MRPETLTKHMLLYEGNFDEWVRNTDTLLSIHGLQGRHERALGDAVVYEKRLVSVDDSLGEQVLQLLRWQISPSLAKRLPADSLRNVSDLFDSLRAHARPFDLLGLPLELQHTMIDLGAHSQSNNKSSVVQLGLNPPRPLQLPELAYVNHEFRVQTMKRFLKDHTFILQHASRSSSRVASRVSAHGFDLDPPVVVGGHVQAWATALGTQGIRLKRHVETLWPPSPRQMQTMASNSRILGLRLRLHYLPSRCLWTDENKALSAASAKRVEDHLEVISKTATGLGLQGEALIMALTSNPGVWDNLEVKVE